jgi:predicted dehydrogenase
MSAVLATSARPLRAAIVGLGNVGSRFDEEEGRGNVWSHAGAYAHLSADFEIIAAVEPNSENRAAFARRMPDVPICEGTAEMVAAHAPDVVSICTPAAQHADVLEQILDVPSLTAVWCEKPLADNLAAAKRMVAACCQRDIPIVVTHNRRFMPLWRRTRQLVHDGAVGTVRCVRIAMPNRILSIGSHAVDLAIMLGGPVVNVTAMNIPDLDEAGERAVAALLGYAGGAYGIVQVTGLKAQLVVEAEILGDGGRMTVREDRDNITLERFHDKPGVTGYNELRPFEEMQDVTTDNHSAFVAAAIELAGLARGTTSEVSCGGEDALAVIEILDQMTV